MSVFEFIEDNRHTSPCSFQEFVENSRYGVFDDGRFSAEITPNKVVVFVKHFKNIAVDSLKEGLITAYSEYLKYSYN